VLQSRLAKQAFQVIVDAYSNLPFGYRNPKRLQSRLAKQAFQEDYKDITSIIE